MINNTIGSKRLYKIFLCVIKYLPSVLAAMKIIGLILGYFGITSFFLTCIGGTSILMLALLYLISFIFRFCSLYRLSLNYVTTITGLTTIDYYFTLPIVTGSLFYMYAFLSGLFIIAWIYVFYKNRNNPKIDYIKQLCETYVCC